MEVVSGEINHHKCALSTGNLPLGGFPRNSVTRIINCPDMTSAILNSGIVIEEH